VLSDYGAVPAGLSRCLSTVMEPKERRWAHGRWRRYRAASQRV